MSTFSDPLPNAHVFSQALCPYCGGKKLIFFCEGHDHVHRLVSEGFLYDRCQDCGAIIMRNIPSQDRISSLYPSEYSAHCIAPQHRRWALLSSIQEKGSVLEIGCGAGNALASFSQFRPMWNVTGIDFSKRAIGIASRTMPKGIFVCSDILSWMRHASDGIADLIICEQVIEHVFNPTELFHQLMRLLAPNGILLLSIPNGGSWLMRTFRSYAHHLEAPRHLFIPSDQSIRILCHREGGRVIYREAQAYPSVFIRSLALASPFAERIFTAVRLPSVMRILSNPFIHDWATPFSKLTYLIKHEATRQ